MVVTMMGWDDDDARRGVVMMVMVMVMVMGRSAKADLGELDLIRRRIGKPCVIGLEGLERFRDRIKQIPITRCRARRVSLHSSGIGAADRRQSGCGSQKSGYFLVH